MVKPIGNLTINLKPKDKVSAKTQARFNPKVAALPPANKGDAAAPEKTEAPAKTKPFRFKKRKR